MINIRSIQLKDAVAVKAIADANRSELGFNTRQKFEEAALHQRGFVALEGETIVGFVLFRHRKIDLQTTLSEICVDKAHRGYHIGENLITELIRECIEMSREFIQLKCPVDLSANHFYQRLGFVLHTTEMGKRRRLNVWRFSIPTQSIDEI